MKKGSPTTSPVRATNVAQPDAPNARKPAVASNIPETIRVDMVLRRSFGRRPGRRITRTLTQLLIC